MSSVSAWTQVAFRFRNDDGSETTATWQAAQNTNISLPVNTPLRLRFLIDETASVAWTTKAFGMRSSQNAAAYSSSIGGAILLVDSANFVDAANTTSQLTGGSGTFLTSNAGMKDTGANASNAGSAGQFFEIEYSFKLASGSWSVGDTCDLRIYNETAGAALNAYTVTPRITVAAAAGPPDWDWSKAPKNTLLRM
jgi:hypothetical protein